LRQAIGLNPNYPDLHYNLGLLLEVTGDYNGGGTGVPEGSEDQPEYLKAHQNSVPLTALWAVTGKPGMS